ncbi:MAG TPA: NEW3 domain-containing protein [Candidatus Sulfotelmatobacter sp.]|nr:NEW3 domain-containing protein [Candidatus Sulfotelmatobacter sp.]
MTTTRLTGLLLSAGLVLLSVAAPAAVTAASFGITTPYPAVSVQPGNNVTFNLDITVPQAERVDLSVAGVPSGWTANIQGGGNAVNAVYVGGSTAATVQLSVTVPQTASAGSQTLTVTARSPQGARDLPLQVTVLGATSGAIQLTTDFAKLSGTATSAFSYSLTLTNTGTQKQTFTLQAQGPDGWQVTVHPASNAQALTDTIDGGANDTLSVSATPPSSVAAGAFPLQVTVAGGGQTATANLEADVTGSPSVSLSTPNQVLNAQVTAGSTGTVSLVVTNTGSTPLQNVAVTASPPSGWTSTFAPTSIATLAPGEADTVTATIKPASDALSGDYDITFTVTAGTATATVDIRTTVQTSPVWGFIGLGLIALVIIGLGWVFRRYGRR